MVNRCRPNMKWTQEVACLLRIEQVAEEVVCTGGPDRGSALGISFSEMTPLGYRSGLCEDKPLLSTYLVPFSNDITEI